MALLGLLYLPLLQMALGAGHIYVAALVPIAFSIWLVVQDRPRAGDRSAPPSCPLAVV